MNNSLSGMPVTLDNAFGDMVWAFPADRFFAYGPEDEHSCRYFGIGQEEFRPDPRVIMMDGMLYAHPATFDKFVAQANAMPRIAKSLKATTKAVEQLGTAYATTSESLSSLLAKRPKFPYRRDWFDIPMLNTGFVHSTV